AWQCEAAPKAAPPSGPGRSPWSGTAAKARRRSAAPTETASTRASPAATSASLLMPASLLRSPDGGPALVRRGAARTAPRRRALRALACAARRGAARLERVTARLRSRIRRARLGRRRRLGRAGVPRLLPLRRAADGAASRSRFAAALGPPLGR